jgi:hypothetical protein
MTERGVAVPPALLGLLAGLTLGGYTGFQFGRDDARLTDYEIKDMCHGMAQIGWENAIAGKDSNWVHVYVGFLIDSARESRQP